jgi:hypothetical protein
MRLFLLLAASAAAAAAKGKATQAPIPPLDPFPLESVAQSAASIAGAIPLLSNTNYKNEDYLHTIDGVITYFKQFQDANGSIIDPYAHQEIQYATPTYAHGAALLVSTGYSTDYFETAALALTSSLTQLSTATCASNHCNFFTFPSMMAYYRLAPLANASLVAQWQDLLRLLDPAAAYRNTGGKRQRRVTLSL